MSVWEWLFGPMMPRWYTFLLIVWLALGRPEMPVGHLLRRYREQKGRP